MISSLLFSLSESKYIELELASEGFQGAHKVGARPRGGAPTLEDRVWPPLSSSLAMIFLLFIVRYSVEFQVIPRTFVSAHK